MNMGLKYVCFRVWFEIKKRSGLFKFIYPRKPKTRKFITLNEWKKTSSFWGVVQGAKITQTPSSIPDFQKSFDGFFTFFSSEVKHLGKEYDWITNPLTGYRYNVSLPWWKINDYNSISGDIKYVWEKSRFSFLYDVIRNDIYTNTDHSEWVFSQISSWINSNPLNSGPNYKCSQEISLRVLNWTYALNYYRNSPHLTESFFQTVMNSIYWQLKHVYSNINFSRIAVRNNHAITETLTLFIAGIFYPFFNESDQWKRKGKRWFEKEIEYQIYEDGTFLQYSMNYHRVVIQLLTWAIKSSDFTNDQFKPVIYQRAYKSLEFLNTCQDKHTGWLPNYGSNDGALFFKFSSCDYRDFRPQLNSLHLLLTGFELYEEGNWREDSFWYNINKSPNLHSFHSIKIGNGWHKFINGGYFVLRESSGLTFIRCGNHKDRPAHADNLHMDVWLDGKNILFDAGSYLYNTTADEIKYFMGTESHNTIMLDNHDQMLKGPRFIWYNWSQKKEVSVTETTEEYIFEGEISAFTYLEGSIRHKRTFKKRKDNAYWIIEDQVINKPVDYKMNQYWHSIDGIQFSAKDKNNNYLTAEKEAGWRSDYYGVKKSAEQFIFRTSSDFIKTTITVK